MPLSYTDAALAVYNPFQQGFTLGDAFDALTQNGIFGVFGYVSPGTKEQLADEEARGLVQASGGVYTYDYARMIADRDVSAVLHEAGADPAFAPSILQKLGSFLNYALILLVLLVALKLISLVRG